MPDPESLRLRFRRAQNLPPLSTTALTLIRMLDQGETEINELEKVIVADPGFASAVLRSCASQLYDTRCTVKQAIMMLGYRSVRAIAVSIAMRGLAASQGMPKKFDPERYRRHSLAVAFMARYLLARRQSMKLETKTTWTGDELFAAGIVHDIAVPLIAKMMPNEFEVTYDCAQKHGMSIAQTFPQIFEVQTFELAGLACKTWNLPEVFVESLMGINDPFEHEKQFHGIGCVVVADYLAARFGFETVPWHVNRGFPEDFVEDFTFEDAELAVLEDYLKKQIDSYVSQAA